MHELGGGAELETYPSQYNLPRSVRPTISPWSADGNHPGNRYKQVITGGRGYYLKEWRHKYRYLRWLPSAGQGDIYILMNLHLSGGKPGWGGAGSTFPTHSQRICRQRVAQPDRLWHIKLA